MALNSVDRFSSRVENYARYRPGYPPEIVYLLKKECGLHPEHVIADIAFGTGLFTRLLLENGNHVIGVEPNRDMREAGMRFLAAYPNFTAVAGTAEATTLPEHSFDFVTAAQAAHWFNLKEARREFVRILKPAGWAVLVWNERRNDSTPFLRDYELMMHTFGTDYENVRHEHTTRDIHRFFDPSPFQTRNFEMLQRFDYAGIEGRVLSSSYTPPPGHPNHQPMLNRLREIFEKYAANGQATLEYDTRVYYGQLS